MSSFVLGGIQTIFNHPWCVSYINNSYKNLVIITSSHKTNKNYFRCNRNLEFSELNVHSCFFKKSFSWMYVWCCYVHSSMRPSVEQKMTRTIFMSWKILLFAISSILFLLYVKVKVIKPKMVRYMETTFSYFNTRETRIKKMLNNSMTLIMMIVEFKCYNNYRSY